MPFCAKCNEEVPMRGAEPVCPVCGTALEVKAEAPEVKVEVKEAVKKPK